MENYRQRDLVIDQEFENLIPQLTGEEYQQLCDNLRRDGCRDAIVVWEVDPADIDKDIILDGHNRYKICRNFDINYLTRGLEFPDREAAKRWIIMNQFGRRNLTPFERGRLALLLKPELAKIAEKRRKETVGRPKADEQLPLNYVPPEDPAPDEQPQQLFFANGMPRRNVRPIPPPMERPPGYGEMRPIPDILPQNKLGSTLTPISREANVVSKTKETLSDIAGISDGTLHKVETILNSAPAEVIQAARSGEISVNKAYQAVKAANELPEEDRADWYAEALKGPKEPAEVPASTGSAIDTAINKMAQVDASDDSIDEFIHQLKRYILPLYLVKVDSAIKKLKAIKSRLEDEIDA